MTSFFLADIKCYDGMNGDYQVVECSGDNCWKGGDIEGRWVHSSCCGDILHRPKLTAQDKKGPASSQRSREVTCIPGFNIKLDEDGCHMRDQRDKGGPELKMLR